MSNERFNEAHHKDRVHFIRCGECGEMIDCRDLDEVFKHETDHKERPDIQYSGSRRVL